MADPNVLEELARALGVGQYGAAAPQSLEPRASTHIEDQGRLSDNIEDRRSWWEPAAALSAFLSNLGAQRTSEYVDHFFGPKASPKHNYAYDPNGLLPGPREGVNPDLGMPTLVDELAAYYGPEAVHRYNNVRWHQLGKLLAIQQQLETLPSRTGLPFPPDPHKP